MEAFEKELDDAKNNITKAFVDQCAAGGPGVRSSILGVSHFGPVLLSVSATITVANVTAKK